MGFDRTGTMSLKSSRIILTCSRLSPSSNNFKYLPKLADCSCWSVDSPSLHISTFYATATANVRWSAFLVRQELLRGMATCTALARRRRSGLEIFRIGIGLASNFLKDVGLVGITPLFQPHHLSPTIGVDVARHILNGCCGWKGRDQGI
jgi:hypothetical protein